jgi:hypothetical protein
VVLCQRYKTIKSSVHNAPNFETLLGFRNLKSFLKTAPNLQSSVEHRPFYSVDSVQKKKFLFMVQVVVDNVNQQRREEEGIYLQVSLSCL